LKSRSEQRLALYVAFRAESEGGRSIQEEEMKLIQMCMVLLMATAGWAGDETPSPPFPDANETGVDPAIAELVRYRIAKHNDSEGAEAEKKIVAIGSNAVPTLIAMAKLAANKDPLVLRTRGVQDYDWDLIRSVQMLVQIGDRRAIPLVSALVKYDDPKPRRMASELEELLCHGSDSQIELDAKSEDPNVARAANRIVKNPDQFAYYKKLYGKKMESNKAPEATR
jgi:hypothetical protein